MFADRAKVRVAAGAGGDGCVSFRREAHVPRGGPDGGDGGRGGDVVFVCDPSKRDLESLRRSPHVRGERGGHGQGNRRHGSDGEDAVIPVPPGTQIDGPQGRRFDLTAPGQRALVARGGSGGHGNKRFATSVRQAPRFAERGLPGEEGEVELRLKLLADAGLVGKPNAGKSSLLARLTRAAPKVGDYPFTTLAPVLGTLDLEGDDRQLVLADIPGLIEGASEGAGLGHEFLAHVERCRALVHLVEPALDGTSDPVDAYRTVRDEIAAYGAGLEELPEIVVLSKADLLPEEALDRELQRLRLAAGAEVAIAASSATGRGLDEMVAAVERAVPREPAQPAAPVEEEAFEGEHATYTPGGDEGFDVSRAPDGVFEVEGRGIELLFRRHDLSNLEALAYLERRMREIGVIRELERAGFEPGDEVRVGDDVFELHPDPGG